MYIKFEDTPLGYILNKSNEPFPGILEGASLLIIIICVFIIAVSVFRSFYLYDEQLNVNKEKKSIVETGTMTIFAVIFYFVIKFQILSLELNILSSISSIFIGNVFVIVGTFINVKGRSELGKYWANQIKIYENHKLLTTGMFGIVRHPLYFSLILVFYGISLIFSNLLGAALNTFIFIPFMYYRARQEEELLTQTFKDYNEYKQRVGLFFPKLWH